LRIAGAARAAVLPPTTADPLMPAAEDARRAAHPALLRRLDHLMTTERIYRQEGLTIGALAAKLGTPEYRLRQTINEGLGHRNFNAFLNGYRIGEAKAALADFEQRLVPVLTIAMDAGFQSIGPFNRAFRAETGMTPTEYRRATLAAAASDNPLPLQSNLEISKSI
jgi:AraC-like DNA-binding protein